VLEFLEKIKMNIGIVNADSDSLSGDNDDVKVILYKNILLIFVRNQVRVTAKKQKKRPGNGLILALKCE